MKDKGNLVSRYLTPIVEPLQRLQHFGVTDLQWERLAKDPVYAKAVADAMKVQNRNLAGEPVTLQFQKDDDRGVLIERIRRKKHLAGDLDASWTQLIMNLCNVSRTNEVLQTQCLDAREGNIVEYILIQIYCQMKAWQVWDEMESRDVSSVCAEESLLYALDGSVPLNNRQIHAPGVQCRVQSPNVSPGIFSLGRIKGQDKPMVHFTDPSIGFPAGTLFLTKRERKLVV